jgi:Flp pilus assembly protein protease CpaA
MARPSLTQKRLTAGAYLVLLAFCAGSYYLGWNLFGGADRKVLAAVMFLGVVMVARYGPAFVEELRAYRERGRSN